MHSPESLLQARSVTRDSESVAGLGIEDPILCLQSELDEEDLGLITVMPHLIH